MFNIGSVSINESFSPLCGVNMTFLNDVSARLEYRKTRVLTLSTTAVQVVETTSDDITAGAGYKITGDGRARIIIGKDTRRPPASTPPCAAFRWCSPRA